MYRILPLMLKLSLINRVIVTCMISKERANPRDVLVEALGHSVSIRDYHASVNEIASV